MDASNDKAERDELVNDLANYYLNALEKFIDFETFGSSSWSKVDLMIDVLVECLSRVHKAHKIQFFGAANDWIFDAIQDALHEKLEIDQDGQAEVIQLS